MSEKDPSPKTHKVKIAVAITEDIITELSRFRSLFVIARNSSFHYKGLWLGWRTFFF